MKTFEEKLLEVVETVKDPTVEKVEWSQSNGELGNGKTEVEVTFKYIVDTPKEVK